MAIYSYISLASLAFIDYTYSQFIIYRFWALNITSISDLSMLDVFFLVLVLTFELGTSTTSTSPARL